VFDLRETDHHGTDTETGTLAESAAHCGGVEVSEGEDEGDAEGEFESSLVWLEVFLAHARHAYSDEGERFDEAAKKDLALRLKVSTVDKRLKRHFHFIYTLGKEKNIFKHFIIPYSTILHNECREYTE